MIHRTACMRDAPNVSDHDRVRRFGLQTERELLQLKQ